MMEKITISKSLELSRIIYGMWRIGDDDNTSPDHIQAKVEACLNQGITSIDQADIYGGYTAETILGDCLKRAPGLRDQLEIVSKCDIVAPVGRYQDARVKHYDTSSEHIRSAVEHSLTDLGTDRLDLLLIHRPDPFMDHHETGRALDELVASGKVLNVGVSNFKPHDWALLQSAMVTPLVTNQIEMSVMARDAFVNGDLAYLQQHGIRPMAWSPLGGGAIFSSNDAALSDLQSLLARIAQDQGVGVDAVACAWLLAHPAGILPVMGTNNLDRIGKLGDALKVTFDRQSWFEVYVAAQGHDVP